MEVKVNTTIRLNDLELEKNELNNMEEKPKQAIKKPKVKTTTIRCSQDTANLINALTTIGDSKSVDETLKLLLDEYMIKLTDNERQQVKTIKKIYDKNSGI